MLPTLTQLSISAISAREPLKRGREGRRITRHLSSQHNSATLTVYGRDEDVDGANAVLLSKFRRIGCAKMEYVPTDMERFRDRASLAILHTSEEVLGTVAFTYREGGIVEAVFVCTLAHRGFGKLLMGKWREWLRQNTNATSIELESIPSARKFYSSIGMREVYTQLTYPYHTYFEWPVQ